MILAVGKGVYSAHVMSKKKAPVRLPLTCSMLSQGRRVVASMVDGRYIYICVMWLGLTVPYFLLCRASNLWAYADGNLHPEFV